MSKDGDDLSKFMPEGWKGVAPPCQIQVDAEGELSHEGAPIVHPKVREEIFSSVCLEDGHYLLRSDGKTCELEVADTFYTIKSVDDKGAALTLTLNDGSTEPLNPNTVWMADNQMLYCQVKEGAFPARFARPAYYQLAGYVEPEGEGFALVIAEKRHVLKKSAKAKSPSAR